MAREAVWQRGGVGGLWRYKVWETLGSQTPTKTGAAGRQTPYAAWAGTAQRSERGRTVMRGTTVLANRHSGWNQGTTHRGRCGAQTGAVDDGRRGMVAGDDGGLERGITIPGVCPLMFFQRKDGVIA